MMVIKLMPFFIIASDSGKFFIHPIVFSAVPDYMNQYNNGFVAQPRYFVQSPTQAQEQEQ